MSGSLSQWLCNELLKTYFTPELAGKTYNRLAVGLTTALPAIASSPAQLKEPKASRGYARVLLPLSSSVWAPSGFREIVNRNDIAFPSPTGYWGVLTSWVILSAKQGAPGYESVVAAAGLLSSPVEVNAFNTVSIPAGSLGLGLYD